MTQPKLVVTDQQMLDPAVIAPAVTDKLWIALYGRWCTRKTLQIHTLIERFGRDKIFIVSVDKGLTTIADEFNTAQRWEVRSISDLRTAWAAISKATNEQPDAWVCFDGMTRVAGWIADTELNNTDECATLIATGVPRGGVPSNLKPYLRFINNEGIADNQKVYGPIGTELKIMITSWTTMLKCNVFMTLLEDETNNGRVKGPPYVPDLPGNVALKHLMSTFDYVMRSTIQDDKQLVQLDPNRMGFYWSRTRDNRKISGELDKEIKDFNLANFVDKVRGL